MTREERQEYLKGIITSMVCTPSPLDWATPSKVLDYAIAISEEFTRVGYWVDAEDSSELEELEEIIAPLYEEIQLLIIYTVNETPAFKPIVRLIAALFNVSVGIDTIFKSIGFINSCLTPSGVLGMMCCPFVAALDVIVHINIMVQSGTHNREAIERLRNDMLGFVRTLKANHS